MAKSPQSFEKRQRERKKQLKRQEKMERRLDRNEEKRRAKNDPDAADRPPSDSGDSGEERGADEEKSEDGE